MNIEKKSSTWPQYLASFLATLALVSYGMVMGWPSPVLHKLDGIQSPIKITNREGAWIATMPFIGSFLGAAVCAYTMEKFGRKLSIIGLAVPYIIGWLLIILARSALDLCLARFISGIGAGATFTVVPVYISEIASAKIRGRLGSLVTIQWNVGILITYIIGSYVDMLTISLVCLTVPTILLFSFIFMPESPYYLIGKGKVKKAEGSINVLTRRASTTGDIVEIQRALEAQLQRKSKFTDIFSNPINRRCMFIVVGLTAIQEFSGRDAFCFYTQIILDEAGGTIPATVGSIVYAFTQLVVSACASSFIDRWGRRPLLMVSSLGCGIALLSEAVYFHLKEVHHVEFGRLNFIPLLGLVSYIIVFSMGLSMVPLILAGEIFPTNIKSRALCFVEYMASVISVIATNYFEVTYYTFGSSVPFFSFMWVCFAGVAFIYWFVPETKGVTLREIQEYLGENRRMTVSRDSRNVKGVVNLAGPGPDEMGVKVEKGP